MNRSYREKLALGTVQFGLDYGISNTRGQVPADEVREILDAAQRGGIAVLDTAHAYGNSESVLGRGLASVAPDTFRIVSKFPPGTQPDMATVLRESLVRLGRENLAGYLFHSLDSYRQAPSRWEEMAELKAAGWIDKRGFSLYQPADARTLLAEGLDLEMVQVPFSVLDQRWKTVFPELKAAGVEIHVRSAFLQGLVFQDPEGLDPHFGAALPALRRLRQLARESGQSIAALCLGFALRQPEIDQVIVGVAGTDQFAENLRLADLTGELAVWEPQLAALAVEEERILLPMHWP